MEPASICDFCENRGWNLYSFNCPNCHLSYHVCEEHKNNWTCRRCTNLPSVTKEEQLEPHSATDTTELPKTPQIYQVHARRHSGNILNIERYPKMFLDINRDGGFDEIPAENIWEWGREGKGAIIPCNVDPENKGRLLALILFNTVIACEGKLRIVNERDKERIRIFAGPSCLDKQILGKSIEPLEHKFKIPVNPVIWGIEATRYDQTEEDQEIMLEFIPIVNGQELPGKIQKAKVRVTPWIMLHHLNTPEIVYSSEKDNNFFTKVKQYAGCQVMPIKANSQFLQDGFEIGCSYFPHKERKDGICVDWVTYRPPIKVWKEVITIESIKMPVFELGTPIEGDGLMKDLMSCGNLEVTPPIGNKYPLGRIYYSEKLGDETFDPIISQFLEAQKVQKPFTLDASWLDVGHVDEIVTFLPLRDRLVALIPSPGKAFELLCSVAKLDSGAKLMVGRQAKCNADDIFDDSKTKLEINIVDFLTRSDKNPIYGNWEELLRHNFGNSGGTGQVRRQPQRGLLQIKVNPELIASKITNLIQQSGQQGYQGILNNIINKLKYELGHVLEVVEIPVIYCPTYKRQEGFGAKRAVCLTENMVNMLVLDQCCIFAEPGGPMATKTFSLGSVKLCGETAIMDFKVEAGKDVFQQYMIQVLRAFGLKGYAIEDIENYHDFGGNVHCGTNTKRRPDLSGLKWWETEPSEGSSTQTSSQKL